MAIGVWTEIVVGVMIVVVVGVVIVVVEVEIVVVEVEIGNVGILGGGPLYNAAWLCRTGTKSSYMLLSWCSML